MPLGMNLATILLLAATFATYGEATPTQIVGRGRSIPEDSAENDALEQLMAGARNIPPESSRRLSSSSPHDKLEVMIKSVDCFACMEAPPAFVNPGRKMLRTDDERELTHKDKDVFVTALNCNTTDPYQVWNMRSLEPTGTWYLFESAETGECMQLVGACNPDGTLYDIVMGPCDTKNFKAFWAFTGVGEIVNFECSRSNWESETYIHSTPDIFLEAECTGKGGIDYLDMSSFSSESRDMAENYWVLYPKSFGSIPAPP